MDKTDDRMNNLYPGFEEALLLLKEALLKNSKPDKEEKNIETIRKDFKGLIFKLNKPIKEFNIEQFLSDLEVYLHENKRLLYSEFTSIIIELNKNSKNDQAVGLVISNLENCIDFAMKNEKDELIQKTLIKLWDHANLASNQYNYFVLPDNAFVEKVSPILDDKVNELKEQYKTLSNEVKNAETSLSKATEKMNGIKNDITSDIIALISIFVAISFVMFGGMSLINGLFDFSGMTYVPMTEMMGLGALLGIVLIGMVYSFMQFTLKITGKYVSKNAIYRHSVIGLLVLILSLICSIAYTDWKASPNKKFYETVEKNDSPESTTEDSVNFENKKIQISEEIIE